MTLCASPAAALSCLKPDVAFSYNELQQATEEYVVLNGVFDKVPSKPEEKKQSQSQVLFQGDILTSEGFEQIQPTEIDVTLTCAGMWCAEMEAGAEYLVFAEKIDDALTLTVGPCYSHSFKHPDQAQLDTVKSCASGGDCEPDN